VSETRPVRASEQLDWPSIEPYLRDRLGVSGGFAVEQFPGGHSNLTYLIRFGDREFVLRRPPFGPLPPRAHDMAREFRILEAVHPLFPLAPKPFLLSEGDFDFTFYVMERRHGRVLRDPSGAPAPPPALIDTLADLHAVDATHLGALGKPAGFMARQIRGWTERWNASKTSEIAQMEDVARWLEARIPADPQRPSLVHGDYKLDNVMLDDANNVVAVLDWEMSAIGDPLVDLGIFLCYTVYVDRALDRNAVLDRYASRSDRSLDDIGVYEVFAIFKLAVVVQQIYARYAKGQTDDPRFAGMGEKVAALARMAESAAQRLGC